MQYSTNYNLNLVEGTDIVNPLVIDKPNYITIDTQMKDNEDAGVGTATEIKTGTVHALTRSNGDNNVFRYVATSVCNAGDTFTVDGVSVTALLPTGEALGNSAYTIGCNVLAILTSTELTIFTGGGTASNAAMLNNQLPSYYLDARNESFDNTGTDLSATNTEAAIKEVNSKNSYKVVYTLTTTGLTWGGVITALKPYYDSLTASEKIRSALATPAAQFIFTENGYTLIEQSETGVGLFKLDFASNKASAAQFSTGSASYSDISTSSFGFSASIALVIK